MAAYQGNPSVHNYGLMTHSNYFLGLLKTRNRFSATSVDQLPHHLTSHLMYGHGLLIPIPDIDHTDFMLILGGNPLASNGSIMTVPDVEKRLKAIQARGGKLVVVDPRRSETAAIADQHLFVRPGSDAPEPFHGIGIRIEDDAIVTDSGCELITRGVPVAPDEIEALMRA